MRGPSDRSRWGEINTRLFFYRRFQVVLVPITKEQLREAFLIAKIRAKTAIIE